MNKSIFCLVFLFLSIIRTAFAQYSGVFVVGGDSDKFYPVLFEDKSWGDHKGTVLEIGRSDVHEDGSWRGSVIARFSYHVTNWGHGSNYIDADIRQFSPFAGAFIAGWTDISSGNSVNSIVIWLKGGGNHYHFTAPAAITPWVYDINNQPFQEPNGPVRSYKTAPDFTVNSSGLNSTGTAYFTGGATNYFAGNVGIGTSRPDKKLTVNGTIHASEVLVDTNIPVPDYVFEKGYDLKPLSDVARYIAVNKHLPEIPSAASMEQSGVNLSEMNMKLLKKVEELTLYLIEKDKQMQKQQETNRKQLLTNLNQQAQINELRKQVAALLTHPCKKP